MSSQEIEIIREKARNEGFAQGRAEGDALARASAIVAMQAALARKDTEAELAEIIDELMAGPCDESPVKSVLELRDKLLGRTAKAAAKPGETQAQAAERMLLENGIGTGKASASSPPDLGDQVVALLKKERGVQ
jgi:hypothetical protein